MTTVLEQALGLSIDEKLELIGALWDSLASEPEKIPMPQWQIDELERRIEAQRVNPKAGQTWEEVKRELLNGNT